MKTNFGLIVLCIYITILYSCNIHSGEQSSNLIPGNRINPELNFKPNILWLVAEDQSPNIPSFGDSTIVTPALDKLAAEGICYDNFFSPHPVCAPARASIITGMYANSIGASHMRTGPWFMDNPPESIMQILKNAWPDDQEFYEAIPPPEVKMFTEYLRKEGYYCTNNAKLDYQFRKTMTAWDESSNQAHWRNRPKGTPFFSVFNFGVTHESQIWGKANDSLMVPENLEVPIPPYLPDTEISKNDIRRMYSNILEMDSQVGEIISQLEEDGLLDSTIVVWYTDHGGPLPRQKRLLFDSGLKVPMIIRFPEEIDGGQRDARFVSFIDLAPTMLSLAGIKPKSYFNGSAFLGKYIRDEEPNYVYGAADRFDAVADRIRSVRDDRYKYIKYYNPEKPMFLEVAYRNQMPIMQELLRLRNEGQLSSSQALWFRDNKPEEELFDTWNDPHEVQNLAQDKQYKEKLLELRSACNQWIEEINDTGLQDEKDLISQLWPEKVQPVTETPLISSENEIVNITCNTEGASIGYKILVQGQDQKGQAWKIYHKPFKKVPNSVIVAAAHRIGYLSSEEVKYEMN